MVTNAPTVRRFPASNPALAAADKGAMPRAHLPPYLPTIAVLVVALVLSASTLDAAPDDGTKPQPEKPPKSILDIRIPIPHEPDAKDNGCRIRQSPAERETGVSTEVPF